MGQLATKQAETLVRARGCGEAYRIDLPLMVLAFRDDHHAAVTIEAGEILEVVGPAQDERFVVVDVRGEQFLVFGCDLKCKCKVVPNKGP